MTNKEIIRTLNQAVKLMELHETNVFKIRTFTNAIFKLEHGAPPLGGLSRNDLENLEGIGKGLADAIDTINQTGSFRLLDDLISKTPEGILELMELRGLGIKKLKTLWKEHHIGSLTDLEQALDQGSLINVKGFGKKTLENFKELIDFQKECWGKIYYAAAEKEGQAIIDVIKNHNMATNLSFCGKLRRKWSVIAEIEIICDAPSFASIDTILNNYDGLTPEPSRSGPTVWRGRLPKLNHVSLTVHLTSSLAFASQLLLKTGSRKHLRLGCDTSLQKLATNMQVKDEKSIYQKAGLSFCEPEIREGIWESDQAINNQLPVLLETSDLRGVIHTHTTYSDGQHTLREMADACISRGYQYLGISDHSKAAFFYANGLTEDRVVKQHEEIDALNNELSPFMLFKGIEADILSNGDLDYDKNTLATFDFVVASIHSGLAMDLVKATDRLLRAIYNPFTTFLGHMTGRLLLLRKGYPVDHETIIKACATTGVIIEINSHPKRLDIDWRWIHRALDEGVVLSVNPDAHVTEGLDDMYYGVCAGRKGGLTKEHTFNAWPLEKVKTYFEERKSKWKN